MISTWCGRICRKNAGCSVHFQILLLHIDVDVVNFVSSFFLCSNPLEMPRPDLDHPECRCRCYVIASFVVFHSLSSPFVRSFVHLSIFINSCRLHSSVTLDQTECVLNCILLNGTQHVVDPWCGNLLVWLFLNVHVNEQRAAFKLRLTQLFFIQFQYEPMSRVCRFVSQFI